MTRGMEAGRPLFIVRFVAFFILSFLLWSTAVNAASEKEMPKKKRPRVGLVLAGGGALGFVHVGVLKVLDELHIPIDVVTGTSMGAIIGAAYASGNSVDEMEQLVRATDWDQLFNESPPRSKIPYRYKPGRDQEILGDAKIAFDEGHMIMPAGVVTGQNVYPFFQRLYSKIPVPCNFDDLPVRFRSVAADIETGQPVIFDSGELPLVVRASMSVPGAFAPVEIGGKYLVDGGIVDNVPIDLALRLGAEKLIIVRMKYELSKKKDLTTPLAVAGQMVNLLMTENARLSAKLIRKTDVYMQPDVNGRSAGDFAGNLDLIEVGEVEARNFSEQLKELSVSAEEYAAFEARRQKAINVDPEIDFVEIANDSTIPDSAIRELITQKVGQQLDRREMEKSIQEVHASGQFESVTYSLIEKDGQSGVQVNAVRKKMLDHYFRFGAAIEDDFDGNSNYRLALGYRTTVDESDGTYLDLVGEIGRSPSIRAELYKPFSVFREWFFAPEVELGREQYPIFLNGSTRAEYQRILGTAGGRVGARLGRSGEATIGYRRGFGEIKKEIGTADLPEASFDSGDLEARVVLDQLDSVDFPTSGYLFDIISTESLEELGSTDEFYTLESRLVLPITWGENTLSIGGDLGQTFQDRPAARAFTTGGLFRLSGYTQNSLLASDMTIGRLLYYRRLSRVGVPMFGLGFYAGASLEYANLDTDYQSLPDKTITAGSVFLGMDTPLLPIYIAYGRSDDDEQAIYLALGRIGIRDRW